jgi:hypothetical protein
VRAVTSNEAVSPEGLPSTDEHSMPGSGKMRNPPMTDLRGYVVATGKIHPSGRAIYSRKASRVELSNDVDVKGVKIAPAWFSAKRGDTLLDV